MPTPRLCIVAPEFIGPFPNGGVGTACYWEAHTLGAAGYDVTVLYTGATERETPEHWESHFASRAPFRYHDLGRWTARHGQPAPPRSGATCHEAEVSDAVLAWLREHRFDLVLCQEFLGHGARSLQARLAGAALDGVRVATTMHSCRQWIYEGMKRLPNGGADGAVDFLEKESARLADHVIFPSRHMAGWAASRWRLGTGGSVIPYCFDASLADTPTAVTHSGPFRHLVFFGRLETRKGLHLFCQALTGTPGLRTHVDRVTFLGKASSVEGHPSDAYIATEMAKVPGLRWDMVGHLGSIEAQDWLSRQREMLVVAPSLVDNLPYAVIELHTRRIPFVSTNIGGIPEIVGAGNGHVLAAPTAASLARVIGDICRAGRLTVDYRSGYDVVAANDAHVACVGELLEMPAPRAATRTTPPFDVVVLGTADDHHLHATRSRLQAADATMTAAHWLRAECWPAGPSTRPALFIAAPVTPAPGCAARLLRALADPAVAVATSYFDKVMADGTSESVQPVGGALESGWRENVFGGPCFAAAPAAFEAIASATVNGVASPWPAYAAVACRGLVHAVVPAPLFAVPAETLMPAGYADVEAVIRQYHGHRPETLDLGWLLKGALSGGGHAVANDLAALDTFFSMPDELLGVYAGLLPATGHDPYVADLIAVRERLTALVATWRHTEPRVFVYGTGSHTRRLLALCPELGRFIGGFIDRRAGQTFLGRPCVSPDQFRDHDADVVLYSSREFEHEMYARLQHAPVEHVLLYRPSPTPPAPTTAARLTARFGEVAVPQAGLDALYHPPAWATGYVSGGDAAFLLHMVTALQPRTVVELGVASGASSAVLLYALDQLPDRAARTLVSCDVRPTCYFNDAYETGQACRELYPAPTARWQREFDMDARRLADLLPATGADLTFIDANHSHPWPLLDLLHVTAYARPGSWVILHDVDLPIQHPEHQVFGPRHLFQAWPFNKVKGLGQWTSIAAVQLPDDPTRLTPLALALLERPWEQPPSIEHAALPAWFPELRTTLEQRLGVAVPEMVTA